MYGLSEKFETLLATGMANSAKLYAVIGCDIDPSKISNPTARLVIATVREIANDVGKAPGNPTVVSQRLNRKHVEGKIDEDE